MKFIKCLSHSSQVKCDSWTEEDQHLLTELALYRGRELPGFTKALHNINARGVDCSTLQDRPTRNLICRIVERVGSLVGNFGGLCGFRLFPRLA